MLKIDRLFRKARAEAGGPPRMNIWRQDWELQDCCPCDLHLNDWLAYQGATGKLIYHFGSGTHHVVGVEQATNGSGNAVFCVTASIGEYDTYVQLAAERPEVARSYLCYFGDIYLANRALLPEFDVAALFHLCEFFQPNTASAAYGGLDDRGVLDLFTDRTKLGGHILLYTGSNAFDKARPIVTAWEQARAVERVGEFKTLLVYRKLGA